MRATVRTIAVVILSVLIPLCSSKDAHRKLYIYNWTYYIPDSVIREFEKTFKVKVVYDLYASNEEMFAKLKAGGGGYDIVFPSGDYVSIMIREGMLSEVDKTKIPNFSLIDSSVLAKIHFDEGCRYSVPYMMGAVGISVNREKIPTYEKSWRLFDRADLRGHCTLLDDMREVLGAALKTLGYSVNSIDTAQLYQARDVVVNWRKNIVKFDAESFGKAFASGEFWMVQGYAENVFLELDSSRVKTTDFFIPKEGGCAYIDNMVILRDSRNKELAHEFINYIHSPEVFAAIVDFLRLPSINTGAVAKQKTLPRYTLEDLASTEIKEDLGSAIELYNGIWQEIRIGK